MPSLNRLKRELLFKIVFYGPGLGGKTTTLQYIHGTSKPENRGELVSLATDTDRTLYFDFLPLKILQLGDVAVKLQLYTVPGQVYYAATRKLVLSGADGIVFVADTQQARLESNLESLDDLNANLADQGRKLSAIPHVFQWNKRDLGDLVPLDELDRKLNLFTAPSIATVATRGEGVFDVLDRVTRVVIDAYRAEVPAAVGARPQDKPLFLDAEEVGITDAIKGLADSKPARPQASPAPRMAAASAQTAGVPSAPASGGAASAPGSGAGSGVGPGSGIGPGSGVGPGSGIGTGSALGPGSGSASVPGSGSAPFPSPARGGHATAPAPPPGAITFSFAELWPESDREAVRVAEHLLAARDASGALSACEDLLSRVLAAGSLLLGGQASPRDPAIVVSLLGLDGTRYIAFRSVARAARGKRAPTQREVLECYAFVVEARRVLDRVVKGT